MNKLLLIIILAASLSSQAKMDKNEFIQNCAKLWNLSYPVTTCEPKSEADYAKLTKISLDTPFEIDLANAKVGSWENSAGEEFHLEVAVKVAGFLSTKYFRLNCRETSTGQVIKGLSDPTVDIQNRIDVMIKANLICN